ncbi:MAG: type II secretion system major pseudopilin GspG [Phycisphaerae bacterium]|nr:type II secretion system major pseudopilin GspG [Phycisphaerae bacterium]
MNLNHKKLTKIRRGFTIIEVMAVLIILGLLATVVGVNVIGRIDRAKVVATKTSLKKLHSAVLSFKMDTGYYPSEEAGLLELVEEPSDVENWQESGYLETTAVPKDGWGREFIYELNPEDGKPFRIISYGADGEEGGEGYDADLSSTDAD